ncbi:unnamed protein product [Protopolystoma xenopodis]|uniref:Uncharacterized protein n=1 Tax=Protopolystoma xenopodis TaxID=117903 RepID=A0A448XFP4_9PLAT|nr:unnamed protein product [Protopolystoma xenopodis]
MLTCVYSAHPRQLDVIGECCVVNWRHGRMFHTILFPFDATKGSSEHVHFQSRGGRKNRLLCRHQTSKKRKKWTQIKSCMPPGPHSGSHFQRELEVANLEKNTLLTVKHAVVGALLLTSFRRYVSSAGHCLESRLKGDGRHEWPGRRLAGLCDPTAVTHDNTHNTTIDKRIDRKKRQPNKPHDDTGATRQTKEPACEKWAKSVQNSRHSLGHRGHLDNPRDPFRAAPRRFESRRGAFACTQHCVVGAAHVTDREMRTNLQKAQHRPSIEDDTASRVYLYTLSSTYHLFRSGLIFRPFCR